MPTVSITLSSNYSVQADDKHRLQVWVSEAVGISPDIFLFDAFPTDPDPAIAEAAAHLYRVCIYADLLNYVPRALDNTPFFRARSVDVLYDTEKGCNDFFLQLQADVQALVDELNGISTYTPEVLTYPLNGGYTLTSSIRKGCQATNEITLTISHDTADTAFFVIDKASAETITDANQDAELLRIATPEDMYTIDTAQPYDYGTYRTSTIVFAVATESKVLIFLDSMIEDISMWVNRFADGTNVGNDLAATNTYTGVLYGLE